MPPLLAPAIVATILALAALIAAPRQFPRTKYNHEPTRQTDAAAVQLLQQMSEAYAHLPALDQETTYFSTIIPLAPDGTPAKTAQPQNAIGSSSNFGKEKKLGQIFKLRYLEPNRLWMERDEGDIDTGRVEVHQWISDGRDFWTYQNAKNWYTRDKAPTALKSFVKLSNMTIGSLELVMMMGVNPFANLKESIDSVQIEETALVNGIQTKVVSLHTTEAGQSIVTRLYIGADDALLRRLEITSTPKPVVSHTLPNEGDPLDELVERAQRTALPPRAESSGVSMKSIVRYDNVLHPTAALTPDRFAFTPPQNALFQQPIERNGVYAHELMKKQIESILERIRQGQPYAGTAQ